jgi:CRP/FNR family transcriptional regulator
VCSGCAQDELLVLEGLKSYKTYEKGQTLSWAEEPLTHLGTVVTGIASLNRTLEDGRCQIVGLLLPSDFIGRPNRVSVAHDVVAATDITLCRFEKPVFERLLAQSPALMTSLLSKTCDDLDAARDWILLLGRKTAREKVAGFLSRLIRRAIQKNGMPAGNGTTVALPLTRGDLANYLGMTLETTSRQFSQLKQEGVIALPSPREVHIPNLAQLFREANEPDRI